MTEKKIAQIFEQVGLAKIDRELANDELTNAIQSAMIAIAEKTELPEDLEEAATAAMPISDSSLEIDCYGGSVPVYTREQMIEMFEAGAKWQASQGHTINAVVNVDGFYQRFIQPSGDIPFECGDKLIVTLRKR